METSKERTIKAINHIQPEITPVHIMGFEEIESWHQRYGTDDDFGLRDKLELDLQRVRTVYTGPQTKRGRSIWGTEASAAGYAGGGYSGARHDYPLQELHSMKSRTMPGLIRMNSTTRLLPKSCKRIFRRPYTSNRNMQFRALG